MVWTDPLTQNYAFDFKYPMFPKNPSITEAVIRYFYLYSLHAILYKFFP